MDKLGENNINNVFNLVQKEITTNHIYAKDILLENLKKLNIKFSDNPIKQLSFIGLNKFLSSIYLPPELSENNLNLYKKMKIFTRDGYYQGLELIKNNKKELVIKTTENFKEDTLLFEVRGEIVSKDYLIKYNNEIKKNKFCYFKYGDGENENENSNLYLLLQKYANIVFFLKKEELNESNCKISEFINNEDGSIKLLCITKKNIYLKGKY
jgi:hypothetical protein